MSGFMRGMRLGAGLVTLGWGASRLAGGRRDWVTTASLTTGASMVMAGLNGTRGKKERAASMNDLLHAATRAAGNVMTAMR